MPTVATYLRSATDEPDSLAQHQAQLDAWLAAHPEHQLVGAFTDTACLRSSPLTSRSGFSALLALVAERKVELIAVPASCTISSDLAERAEIVGKLLKQGCTLLSTEEEPQDAREAWLRTRLVEVYNAWVSDQKRQSAAHARACKAQKRALRLQTA